MGAARLVLKGPFTRGGEWLGEQEWDTDGFNLASVSVGARTIQGSAAEHLYSPVDPCILHMLRFVLRQP